MQIDRRTSTRGGCHWKKGKQIIASSLENDAIKMRKTDDEIAMNEIYLYATGTRGLCRDRWRHEENRCPRRLDYARLAEEDNYAKVEKAIE